MSYLSQELVRVHVAERLHEAEQLRVGARYRRARRLSRKAEKAARAARVAGLA